jgi:hypothetical protein
MSFIPVAVDPTPQAIPLEGQPTWEAKSVLVIGVAENVVLKARELGRDGWELVQVGPFIPNTDYNNTVSLVWFKRKS